VASYTADINLNIVGASRLNAVISSVAKLNALAQDLKPINLGAPGGGKLGDKIREAIKPVNDFAREVTNGTKRISNTFAGASQQADVFRTVLDNVKVAAGGFSKQTAPVKLYATALTEAQAQVQRLSAAQQDLLRTSKGLQLQDERNIETSRRLTRVLELRRQKTQGAALAQSGKESASNALIGGAFPLLFGQGAGAAVGGGLGGALGGAFGGTLGFGLSLVGTAIGQAVDDAAKLNVTLAGLNATISSAGAVSITTANDVSQLAKNLQITKDEAIELVGAFNQFNDGNVRESLARGFGAVGGAQTFEAIAKAGLGEKEALDAIFSLRKQIGNEAAEQLALQLKSVGATETQAALLKIVSERNIAILVAQSKTVQFTDRLLSAFENIVAALASAVSLAVRFIAKMQEGSLIKLPFLDRIQQVLGKVVGRTSEQITGERGAKLEQQLRRDLADLRKALRQETRAQGVQSSLAESLKPERGGKSAAEREAERLAQQRQKQLEDAARLAVSTDTQVKKAAALTEQEKLTADLDQQRMERMVRYETLYKEALSNAAIEYYVMAQTNELATEKINYEKELLNIALRQSEVINKTDPLASTQKEIELIAAKLQGKEEEYLRQQQINDLVGQNVPLEDAIAQVDTLRELNTQLEQQVSTQQLLNNTLNQIGQTAASVFESLIFSTDNWSDSLNNALRSLASLLFQAGLQGLAGTDGQGFFSFLTGGLGKRAAGGPVSAGSPYIVGERGPELFVPGRSGTIVPNDKMGGENVNVVVNVDAKGTNVQGNDQQGNQLGRAISAAVQQELIKQKRPGGLLA
jgi:hypothetical protein